MNYWFDLGSKELYKNSERLNSDVCFFISKSSNEVHSGIHIYSDDLRDNNLRNILLNGEIVSANITDDYYKLEGIDEIDTDNYLLLKHIINDQNNKEFVFYLLYTHLLPANYYKFAKLKENDEYEFKDKVNKDSIDKYTVFEHSYPFYVIPEIKLLKGTDIDIVGTNIVKGYVGKVKITNKKNVLHYIILSIKEEGFNPATVECLMNKQDIKLSDIQCNGNPEEIKVKKDAFIYNLNHHKFAKLDKDCTFKFIDYDSSKKRVKVEIQGKIMTEIEEGFILAKETEGNVYFCRKVTDKIYAAIANTEKEKSEPPQERLREFLQNYYPLSEISSEDKSIKENIIEIDEDVISKLGGTKQRKIKEVLKNYSIESKEKNYILINKKNIVNITDRLNLTANKDCNLFYYDKDIKVKKIEIEDNFNKIRDKLNTIEKDICKLNNKNIRFFVSHFVENEGSGKLLHYKVMLLEKTDENKVCKAKLYISDAVKEEVYIDEDDIIEIYSNATVTGSSSKKKGLICYKNDIPYSILEENKQIDLVAVESFNTFYNLYKELLKNENVEKIQIHKDGDLVTVKIDKNINLEFSIQVDKNNLITKVQTDTILGHMAKQSDRKYVDIALFTFNKADFKWFQWKIPSGTQLFKTVLVEDSFKKQFLSNRSIINLKPSANFAGFSQIVSVTFRVCIYINITSTDKNINKLLDTTVKEFTCFLGYTKFKYKNGKTTCINPQKAGGAETTLACDLLSAFFSGKREIFDINTAKDSENNNYWIFSFTNSDYFNNKELFIKNVTDSSITINNGYQTIYERLSYKDEEYCNIENDLYLDIEPKSNKGKYYFDYDNTNCFLKVKTFNKVDRLKMSELFHTVKIDDKGQLYTSNYGIFDIFENIEKKYKTNALLQLLFSFDNKELVESIRYGAVQKPLEFDKEKKNDEFVKALRNAGFTAIEDEKKDYWSNIKEQARKLFNRENCFWFYHPVTFLDALDSMGILNIHAKELRRVQGRIVNLKCLIMGGVGPRNNNKSARQTWCNYAVYFTIRALDENFENFTGREGIPDKIEDLKNNKVKDEYKSSGRKASNIWCDVLEYQAEQKIIKKIDNPQYAQDFANKGFIVIVAWKNTSLSNPQEASPHFATVAPGYDYDEAYGCMLANVGAENGFLRETGTNNSVFGSRTPRKYFYNPNQKFRENYDIGQKTISEKNYYPSIEAMENMWGI